MCTSWKDYPRLLHWLLRLSVQEQSQEDFEPGGQKRGWPHEAASRLDLRFRDEDLFHRVPAPVRALIRSQGGPMAGMALSTSPTSHLTRLEPHLFRTILLCRFRQPLPLSERSCWCGRPLDSSATTVQLVFKLGSWGGEVLRSRVRQPAFVVRQVAESESTSETRTSSCQTPTMAEDWRSWLTVCLYLEDANWPLLEPSMPMGQLAWEGQTEMEWQSWRRDDAKKPPIQS